MANAVISKGITLGYMQGEGPEYTPLTNLQEIPDLGGTTEAIDITTLADPAYVYTDGIKDYGDSLEFTFLYEATQFTTLNGLTESVGWKVTLPDKTTCTFTGKASVKLSGVGVNAALTYVLAIRPDSEMVFGKDE